MVAGTVRRTSCKRKLNDYTGSVCLLISGGWTLVDVEELPLLLRYNWRIVRVGRRRLPRVAATIGGEMIYLHRFLLAPLPSFVVDHVNRTPLDNRRRNLRIVTQRENTENSEGQQNGSSRFKGVAWTTKRQKWTVFVGRKANRHLLGAFDCEIEAAQAYNRWVLEHFGAFAYLNPV